MARHVSLNSEQQSQLAKIIYSKEVEAIHNIKFNSEPELAKYLRDSRACYESVLKLLSNAGELKAKFQNNRTKAPIAGDIASYVLESTDFSLQFISNYHLRNHHLNKIGDHFKVFVEGLENLNTWNWAHVARLADEASMYKNVMVEYTAKYRSPASHKFSLWLKEKGVKFPELVESYKQKLGYKGSFKDMEDTKKIMVYDEIMEASGRGKVVWKLLRTTSEAAGKSALVFSAAMAAWDVFSSDNILHQATREVVVKVVGVKGGEMLANVAVAAMSTMVITGELSFLSLMAAGIVTGLVGGFILGAFSGVLIDLFFSSGGSAPFSTDGHRCYIAPLPDGQSLARQIVHQSNK